MSDDEAQPWLVGRISGLIALGWVAIWAAAIGVLGTDRKGYNAIVRVSGNVGFRLLFVAVVFAASLHAIDGLGRCLGSPRPELWRTAAWFVACALGVPAAAIVLWPFIDGRFA
jgi:hypothetical protein